MYRNCFHSDQFIKVEMKETSKMYDLNCQKQAHTRVCEENKLEKMPIETILWLKMQV